MTYSTIQGDEWDYIAKKTLGDEAYASLVMQANTKHMHISIFPSGIVLNIPQKPKASINSLLPPWVKKR